MTFDNIFYGYGMFYILYSLYCHVKAYFFDKDDEPDFTMAELKEKSNDELTEIAAESIKKNVNIWDGIIAATDLTWMIIGLLFTPHWVLIILLMVSHFAMMIFFLKEFDRNRKQVEIVFLSLHLLIVLAIMFRQYASFFLD